MVSYPGLEPWDTLTLSYNQSKKEKAKERKKTPPVPYFVGFGGVFFVSVKKRK
jgi:hypothetical protein